MSHRECALLAAWGSAWLQGHESFDVVLDAVSGGRPSTAGPGFPAGEQAPLSVALTDWRRAGAQALRLALPVPGDARGLGGPADFRTAAMSNGQAVFGPGFGLTSSLSEHTASSAPRTITWQRGPLADEPIDYLGVPDAEHELAEAIRTTASQLAGREAPSWLSDVGGALAGARRAGERLNLPASHPPRAVRVIAQAERLSAVLRVVDADATGEVTARGMQERSELLQPLRIAVRRALLAGYNAAAEVSAR